MGFKSRRSTRLPLTTARHKALRLAWDHQHQHWTIHDWKHVVWSDEYRFQIVLGVWTCTDMNIIEYIWDALQLALQNTSEPPRSSMNLWTALQDLWRELPPRYLQALEE
ncbi:hypothetical protein AVEN_71595-1 [Araneus ventricosus]|uniref:Transposase Tc1-like domain-containing protein n=1 Tax=Araneus ventricosus TaxID=182803 RepID=A0A4Y2M9U5_ARAVE|nr:hypothetical protein AVEN_71595-1 [Araneus ventricosus]